MRLAKKIGLIGLLLTIAILGIKRVKAAYTTPKLLSSSANDVILPQLITDKDGYIHLTWMDVVMNDWGVVNEGIFYSRWNGDTWSTPVKISANTNAFAESPSLASDSLGQVHAIYDDDVGIGGYLTRMRYTRRNTDGTWTTPETLPHPATVNYAWNGRIVVDTNNNLHVIYSVQDNPKLGGTFYYTMNDGSGWSVPVIVSYDTDGVTPLVNTQNGDLFADKQGNVHAVFWDWHKGVFYRSWSGGSWSAPEAVTGVEDVEFVRLTVDDSGNPFVAWFQTYDMSVRVRGKVGGVWQTEETLKVGAMRSFWGYPILGVTAYSDGTVAAGWGEPSVAGNTIDIVYRYNSGGGWSTPERVRTDTINSDTPWLYRDKWDNQHLVWVELNAGSKWELWYSAVQGTQQTVGTNGGTVSSQIGGTTYTSLDIARNALTASTQVTILIGPLPESVNPLVVTMPRAFTFGPTGQTFTTPVDATFNYTVEELAGGDPQTLRVYVWDSQTNSWAEKTGSVNTGKKTLTAQLDHFSLHAVAARAVETQFLAPTSKREVISGEANLVARFKLQYKDTGGDLDPAEIEVKVRDGEGDLRGEPYVLGIKPGTISFNEGQNFYLVNVSAKELGLGEGEYTLEVYRSGVVVGSLDFGVKGKGKP